MSDHRIFYRKEDTARYISHLDTMRTFQRALARAELGVRFTQGYHPHADVSILLPLPVGFSSRCEVLECTLLEGTDLERVPERLNAVLPRGLWVEGCAPREKAPKELTWVDYQITLEYDGGTPADWGEQVRALLAQESWVVEKKSKKARTGVTTLDLIPLIRSLTWKEEGDRVVLEGIFAAQNPGLNPQVLVDALAAARGELRSDYARFLRRSLLDSRGETFR